MDKHTAPIAVIGAGASGLLAAIAASRVRPHSVLLLEKEARVGRKLLATGNGRCNLLNLRPRPEAYHGTGQAVAEGLLERMPPRWQRELFASLGLVTRAEAEGRVYPYSGQAGAVLDALRAAARRQGVETLCDAEITRVEKEEDGFLLHRLGGEAVKARRVIMAAGGKAAPAYGANGQGFCLMRDLGHTVTALRPALSPLKLPAESVRGLKGVRAHGVLRLYEGSRLLRAEAGEALFTDYGVSGVAVMQLSRAAGEVLDEKGRPVLSLELVPPDMAAAQVALRVELYQGELMEHFFTGLLHKRIGLCLLREAGIAPADPIESCHGARLLPLLSDWRMPVLGVLPFEKAQITAGGIPLREFSPDTLESRRVPGLHACGEMLDVDGDCGGYNLMWAWASGFAAGEAAARALEEET